jgi:dTDP-glucose 4,6-dehydratase
MTTLLVTGGCGFIGSEFIRQQLATYPDQTLFNLDALTYAGNLDNLAEIAGHPNYTLVRGDVADADLVADLFSRHHFDLVVHFAAESHVDRSLQDSGPFVRTNIQGTQILLDAARRSAVTKYVQVSTDEVYGSLGPTGLFTEETPLAPNSPYSSSKAAADLLVRAYVHSFGFPAVITRCSNNYGPYQFPEKLIPLFVTNLFAGKQVPVYGSGLNVRDWIHVADHCRGVDRALRAGTPGEVYNFGGACEKTNLEITRLLIDLTGRDESAIRYVTDRAGHDHRYAIDFSKAHRDLGWEPQVLFETGLAQTVDWYRTHPEWVDRIHSGAYRAPCTDDKDQVPTRS